MVSLSGRVVCQQQNNEKANEAGNRCPKHIEESLRVAAALVGSDVLHPWYAHAGSPVEGLVPVSTSQSHIADQKEEETKES